MNRKKLLLSVAIIFASYSSQAQIYNYYQIFMYNFAKYIQWPAEKQSGDFVIGVLGKSPLVSNLENMAATKKVGSQDIRVVVFESIDQVSNCHMLFIPSGKSSELNGVRAKLQNSATLLITENEGLARKGSNINFIVVDGKLRFELNKDETERANLKVSGDLTKLAILI